MAFPTATGHTDDFDNPPRRWLRLLLIAGGGAVLLLAVTAVLVLPGRLDCGGFGSDLERRGGECVGVSDGSYAFVPSGGDEALTAEFRTVQELIKRENDRVAAEEDDYVKVGLIAPLTPDDASPQAPERVLRALEGAYTAQMRANHTQELGDRSPQIQLYPANVGSRHDEWQPAVAQLAAMADDEAPLVAAVGLAISTEASRATAQRLAEHDIPLVAASASADGLNHSTVPGLIRVTASNTDFVSALRHYVQGDAELRTAVLVHDERAPDLHVATLTEAFRQLLAEELGNRPDQPFQGTTVDADAPRALFDAAVRNICQAGPDQTTPDMVLFSGRTGDLGEFLEAMHNRPCRDDPIAVLFVETGPVIAAAEEERLAQNKITVVQASAMDPAWYTGDVEPPAGFAPFVAQYGTHLPHVTDPGAALENGYAIANHDALATAVRAIRVSHAEDPDSPMTGPRVRQAFFLLHLDNAVEAAAGTLSFTSDRQGDPGGKPVPVIETPARGDRPDLYTTPEP
jgi:ABC-type branched-subunit amino acid transport system substrate-binding protein